MKPNLLLINCDDLGTGPVVTVGAQRYALSDELAAGGRRFTDFYMASPVCSSRGAMMTGCYPPRIGFGSFHDDWVLFPGDDIGLHPDEYTWAICSRGRLCDHGRRQMALRRPTRVLPTRHGFDGYMVCRTVMTWHLGKRPDMPPLPLISGEEVIEQQPDQTALTERYVERSVRFMRENKDRPFFLYLAHMHVHLPLYAAAPFVKASRNGDYGACVAAIDWATKALVHELKTLGLLENTLIIFTSDNGSRNDRGDSNGPLRGTKATTWEGGQRVPFIVYWKDHIKPGVNEEIICALDLLPSFAAMLGIDLPTDRVLDGVNQWELLTGQTEQSNRDTFYYYMCENLEAVRRQNWKLRFPTAGCR